MADGAEFDDIPDYSMLDKKPAPLEPPKRDEHGLLPIHYEKPWIFRPGQGGQKGRCGRKKGSVNKSTLAKIEAARRVLAREAEAVARGLLSLTTEQRPDAEPCPMCGRGMPRPEEIRLRALTSVLDRVGIGPSSKIEVDQNVNFTFVQYLTEEQVFTMDKWIQDAMALAAATSEQDELDDAEQSIEEATG